MPARITSTCLPSSCTFTTVDSMPTSQIKSVSRPLPPPSGGLRIKMSASERSSHTCSAVVGLTCPKRFADGAAKGIRALSSNCRATGCRGLRTPTQSVPAVTSGGTAAAAFAMMVRGPGQKALAKAEMTSTACGAKSSRSYKARASSSCNTCTMSGSLRGRFLASKMEQRAFRSEMTPPRP
eukprot:scaffold13_cov241-Pinguiococcus_pyrenoidosus.AAC.37